VTLLNSVDQLGNPVSLEELRKLLGRLMDLLSKTFLSVFDPIAVLRALCGKQEAAKRVAKELIILRCSMQPSETDSLHPEAAAESRGARIQQLEMFSAEQNLPLRPFLDRPHPNMPPARRIAQPVTRSTSYPRAAERLPGHASPGTPPWPQGVRSAAVPVHLTFLPVRFRLRPNPTLPFTNDNAEVVTLTGWSGRKENLNMIDHAHGARTGAEAASSRQSSARCPCLWPVAQEDSSSLAEGRGRA